LRSRVGSTSSRCSKKSIDRIVEQKAEESNNEDDKSVEYNPVKTVLTGPDHPVTLSIESRTDITSDTSIFTVKLPSGNHVLGYPTGYHIRI